MHGRGLPDHRYLNHYEPPVLSRFYTSDMQLLHEFAVEKRLFIPFSLIPQKLKEAFMAAEDGQFYSHFGVDIPGMTRAVFLNTVQKAWGQSPGGASTITQQVAKNFLVGNERSLKRKIKEFILAIRLEYALPKDRIFELYLNQIYLGKGAYGVGAAALVYFNKELDELDLEEIALLAALPKAPSSLTQSEDYTRLKVRRNWVLSRMQQLGMISLDQAEKAQAQDLSFNTYREKPIRAEFFIDEIRRFLNFQLGKKGVGQGGLVVRTTLNPDFQNYADEALKKGLLSYDRRHGWRGPLKSYPLEESDSWRDVLKEMPMPSGIGRWSLAIVLNVEKSQAEIGLLSGVKGFISLKTTSWAAPCLVNQEKGDSPDDMHAVLKRGDVICVDVLDIEENQYTLEQIPNVSGGLIAMDPKTGRVLCLSSGYDYELNQYNCATQALRQMGSCFKPFVYLVALERGFTPDSELLDSPITIPLGDGLGFYTPQNYSKTYLGKSILRVGLEESRNVMTVRLAQKVGMKHICQSAKIFGIMENMPKQYAMVLGAGSTSLLKLVLAYGMIANGGYRLNPYFIDSVQDRYGNILFQREDNSKEVRLVSQKSIADLVSMLQGVVVRGTARSLQTLSFPVAGKTGSTNNFQDALFVGFTPDIVVGVFVGFAAPRTLGHNETGARVAVPIFKDFIGAVYKGRSSPQFDVYSKNEPMSSNEDDILYLN